jgi:ADP-heptose:LPS heptosyltransferase
VVCFGDQQPGNGDGMQPSLTYDRFDDVHRIAILRGGGLGDLLVVEPAIRALASAYPEAEITLLGAPLAVDLLSDRPGPVTHVEQLPVKPGVRDGGTEDPAVTSMFLDRMQARRFDLAVQLHGGGRNSNPFLLELGARHTVGMATPDALPLERNLTYVYYQHEILRALEVVALAGAVPVALEPRIDVTHAEHERGAELASRVSDDVGPLLALHPGATDPRRRWPADRFAEVAAQAVEAGARVVIVGDQSDAEIGRTVLNRANGRLSRSHRHRLGSLVGQLSLSELVGLFAHTDVMLGNDSGPRHLAQAVGSATVGIYWIGNLINAGPLTRGRHRVELSWTTHCPVCGLTATQGSVPRCEHDVSFVADVNAGALSEHVADLITATTPPPRGR